MLSSKGQEQTGLKLQLWKVTGNWQIANPNYSEQQKVHSTKKSLVSTHHQLEGMFCVLFFHVNLWLK